MKKDQRYSNLAATCVRVLCHTDVYNFQHIPLFSKKMSHEINRAFRLLYKGTFCKTKLPEVEVVLGLFLPKHCTITSGRVTLNLEGILEVFGADMFEAEINKLKEKKSNTVLTFKESYD